MINQLWPLLVRQWYLVRGTLVDTVINAVFVWPLIYSIAIGYFGVALYYFPENAVVRGTETMISMMFMQIFVTSFSMAVDLLDERDKSGIFQYHIMATSFAAALVARMLFYVVYVYLNAVPFMLASKLFLGTYLYTEQVSWLLYLSVLFLVTALVVSYMLCIVALVKTVRDVEFMWSFAVEPALWVCGLWVPAYVMLQSGIPGISTILACNPFSYATDALRYTFFYTVHFATLVTSCAVLTVATVVFTVLSYCLLKRRLQVV